MGLLNCKGVSGALAAQAGGAGVVPLSDAACAADGDEASSPVRRRRAPLDLLTDEALMERVRQDDREAFRLLVERHADRLYGLALRILRNPSDAEDISQDTLIKVWTHRHQWKSDRARLSTWLYRVVVNRCIDLTRRPVSDDLSSIDEPADDQPDALTGIHEAQVAAKLEAALARLPDQQRAAILLSYYENLGNAEIAEVMQTTVSAVESLLKRGRMRLREVLKLAQRDLGYAP